MDTPPAYSDLLGLAGNQDQHTPWTPAYSPVAADNEHVVHFHSQPQPSSSSCLQLTTVNTSCDFLYKSPHAEVNLGPKLVGVATPAFGLNGIIQGRIKLIGCLDKISEIFVVLEGKLTTTASERGHISGVSKTCILSQKDCIVACGSTTDSDEHSFSLTFPTYARGETKRLPASRSIYLPGLSCEVTYFLRVEVSRKGLRRHETIKVPILYLPRSFPPLETPRTLPLPQGDLSNAQTFSEVPADVKSIQLKPIWPKGGERPPNAVMPWVFLQLPNPTVQAFNHAIPLTLSIVCPCAPAITPLLVPNIRITLLKRSAVRSPDRSGRTGLKDVTLGIADVLRIDESREGQSVLFCELKQLRTTPATTWSALDFAWEKCFVKVTIQPPENAMMRLPAFEHEEHVVMTTDAWDCPERELMALGGVPTPALIPPQLDRRTTWG